MDAITPTGGIAYKEMTLEAVAYSLQRSRVISIHRWVPSVANLHFYGVLGIAP